MKTVLLLEGDAEKRSTVRRELAGLKVAALEASTIAEAERALATSHVDLLIAHGSLSDGVGLSLIERLRERDQKLPVIYVSTFFRDLSTYSRLMGDLRVSRVVYQPVDPAALAEQVLDLLSGEPKRQKSPESAAEVRGELEFPGRKSRFVLIVDDDLVFLETIRRMTSAMPVEILSARTASEALEQAKNRSLMLAILDVHLEGEESFSLAHGIRAMPENGQVPVAFMSVDGAMETRVAAIEAGGTRFLEKPISRESLDELVQHFIRVTEEQQGRVLLVDDDRESLELHGALLKAAGFTVDGLYSAERVVECLEESTPDVVILEVDLPRISGIDVCKALRISQRWDLIPILMLTSRTDSATRLLAFRAGANDVIVKPVLPEELLARVCVQEERIRLIREHSDKDSLSGLLLRRPFYEALQGMIARCLRESLPVSVVLIDLDHFKRVNDHHGHLAGDQVISALGELLRQRFRVEDLRGRWGGEEFILAFQGQGVGFAIQATERILREFSAMQFRSDDERPFFATFTAGVAAFPEDGTSISEVLRRADERLYAGKHLGRNRVQGETLPLVLPGEAGWDSPRP